MNRVDNNYEAQPDDVLLGLKLKDSYNGGPGDGWQAAHVALYTGNEWTNEEVKVGEMFTTGSEADRAFAVQNTVVYKIVLDGGSFPDETSVELYDMANGAFSGDVKVTLDPPVIVRYFKMENGVYKHMYIKVDANGNETLEEGDILPADNVDGKFHVVPGCMDSDAVNYNADANEDNGSCEFTSKTVAMLVEEQFVSAQDLHLQGGPQYKAAVAELINIQGVTADNITFEPPNDTELGATHYANLPNWQYYTTSFFTQRITFQVPDNFVVSASGARKDIEILFGNYTARAVTDIVDVVDEGCTDLGAANFNLAAQANDGTTCVYE